jgi:hypothetical protein
MSETHKTATHCKAKTKGGRSCKMKPLHGSDYCYTHSPEAAAERAQSRRAGGLATKTPHSGDLAIIPADIATVTDARAILNYTLAELLVMDNGIARARVLLAAHDSFIRSFEIGELEERIAALEARAK